MTALTNKIAIVTGAGSGFGAAIAKAFVQAGAKVVLADLRLEAAQAVAQELGANALAVACDVSKGEQVQTMVDQCVHTSALDADSCPPLANDVSMAA